MQNRNDKKKVILDFDNTMGLPKHEIDDGLTLLYLLGREDIEILGVTTTYCLWDGELHCNPFQNKVERYNPKRIL